MTQFPFPTPWGFLEGDYHPLYDNQITVHPGDLVVPTKDVGKIFPRLAKVHNHPFLHSTDLQNTVLHKVRSRRVDQEIVCDTVTDLFTILRNTPNAVQAFKAQISEYLTEQLNTDLYYPGGQGLLCSRSAFSTLACCSKTWHSKPLANALAFWFIHHREEILHEESPECFVTWGFAILDLENRLSPNDVGYCYEILKKRPWDIANGNIHNPRVQQLIHKLGLSIPYGIVEPPMFGFGVAPPVMFPQALPAPIPTWPALPPPEMDPQGHVLDRLRNLEERQGMLEYRTSHLEHGHYMLEHPYM